ncbi:hypothetical protein B0H14DRAFT_2560783 [Mycena olivaceomarginata]|nr:hypothetical protein B0H14DRAFT_2560783 [Mycena olivaceomarginata]
MTKGSQLPVILSTMLASKLNEPKSIEMVFKTSPYMLALLDRSPWPTALCTVLPYQAPWLNPHHSRSRFSGPTARTAPIPRTFQIRSAKWLWAAAEMIFRAGWRLGYFILVRRSDSVTMKISILNLYKAPHDPVAPPKGTVRNGYTQMSCKVQKNSPQAEHRKAAPPPGVQTCGFRALSRATPRESTGIRKGPCCTPPCPYQNSEAGGRGYLKERGNVLVWQVPAIELGENRDELALKQRQVRKRAFIHKYGLYAHIQRRFDAPIPGREPDSEPEDADEEDLSWGPVEPGWAPLDDSADDRRLTSALHTKLVQAENCTASVYFDMNEHQHLRKLFLLVTVHTVQTDAFLGSHVNPQPSTLDPSVDFSLLPKTAPQRLTYSEPTSASSSPVFSSPTLWILPVGLLQSSSRISMHCIPPYHASLGHEGRNDARPQCRLRLLRCLDGEVGLHGIRRTGTPTAANRVSEHGTTSNSGGAACATSSIKEPVRPSSLSPSPSIPLRTGTLPPLPAPAASLSHPPPPPCPRSSFPKTPLIARGPPAGSPFGPSSTSFTASTSSTVSTGSAFDGGAPLMGVKKEEEEENAPCLRLNPPPRVTPSTRVLLSPSGRARGDLLVARAAAAAAAAAPTVAASPHREEEVTPTAPNSSLGDCYPTLGRRCCSSRSRPPSRPRPAPRLALSNTGFVGSRSAQAAAGRLGMSDAKIMVSENAEKLQAWMLGERFFGEDDF